MQKLKPFIVFLLGSIFFAGIAYAAPAVIYQHNVLPQTTDTYDNGTSTLEWNNVYAKTVCVSGDCKSAWPAGGSGVWPFTTGLTNFGTSTQSTTTPEWFKTGVFASSTSQFAYASTTALNATTICLDGDTCRTTWPTGTGIAWPFTPSTNFGVAVQSTSTPESFTSGVFASSTSQFVNANIWGNLTLIASTSRLLATDSAGNVVATSSIGTNFLTGALGTINTTFPLGGGGSFSSGGTLTLTNAFGTTTNTGISANKVLYTSAGGIFAGVATSSAGFFAGTQTNGFVLGLSGGVPTWVATTSNAGTVTSITGGTGLNGGTITTSGTLSLKSYVATSTADTSGQVLFFTSSNATPATFGGNSAFSFSTAGNTLLTVTNASTTNLSVNGNEVSGQRYPSWGYATSTTWTGTTTVDLLAPFAGTLSTMQCKTDTGTLQVLFKVAGSAVTPELNASTTVGTITFSAGNTFTKGQDISVDFGGAATSPTKINCTGIATGF